MGEGIMEGGEFWKLFNLGEANDISWGKKGFPGGPGVRGNYTD